MQAEILSIAPQFLSFLCSALIPFPNRFETLTESFWCRRTKKQIPKRRAATSCTYVFPCVHRPARPSDPTPGLQASQTNNAQRVNSHQRSKGRRGDWRSPGLLFLHIEAADTWPFKWARYEAVCQCAAWVSNGTSHSRLSSLKTTPCCTFCKFWKRFCYFAPGRFFMGGAPQPCTAQPKFIVACILPLNFFRGVKSRNLLA